MLYSFLSTEQHIFI